MKKRIVSLFLTIVVVLSMLSMAACGEKTPQKVKPSVDTEGIYEGIEKYRSTTLKFATWIDHTKSEAASVFASFAEEFGIEIELVLCNQKEYVTKVSADIAAGNSPDIIVDNSRFPQCFPLLQPLNDVSSIDLTDDFWEQTIIKYSTLNGKTYTLNSKNSPWSYRGMVFYNTKLFEDNGFKTPTEYYEEGNWTVDTFKECATRIARLGSDYIGAGIRPHCAAWIYGTSLVTYENEKFINNADDETLLNAYKYALENRDGKVFNTNEVSVPYMKGTAGMEIWTDFGLRKNGTYMGMNPDQMGLVPLPKLTADGPQPAVANFRSYGIARGSKNAEAVGYFLRYFLDYENYDPDTIFLNEKFEKFYHELRENEDNLVYDISNSCLDSVNGEGSYREIYEIIEDGSASQLNVNIKRLKNEVQASINKSNKIIEDKIANPN